MLSLDTIATTYNNEVIVPEHWRPVRFERRDWQWMKNIAQSGPGRDMWISDVQVGEGPSVQRLNCQHRTQPGRNTTIFYRRIDQQLILILGIGRHVGKSKTSYEVEWADGSTNRIELKKKNQSGPQFLSNPLGRDFAFKTLDSVLNANHVHITSTPVDT